MTAISASAAAALHALDATRPRARRRRGGVERARSDALALAVGGDAREIAARACAARDDDGARRLG